MRLRRTYVVAVVAVMMASSCTNGDGESTTTTSTTEVTAETTVPEQPGTTTPPETTTTSTLDLGGPVDLACFYLDGFLVVEEGNGQPGGPVEALLGGLATRVSAGDVLGEDSPAVDAIDGMLDLMSTNEDPLEVAEFLIAGGIPATPVHAAVPSAHWRFMPGTDPIPTQRTFKDDDFGSTDKYVAVVDSGIVEEGLPRFMKPPSVLYDPTLDTEQIGDENNVASHGTFITSLVRQLSPDHKVSFTKARTVPISEIVENLDEIPPGVDLVSTELHVAEAIIRQIDRPELTEANVDALNLSLGFYSCRPGTDPVLITTVEALKLWFVAFPEGEVFMAGGNDPYPEPFWPAGLTLTPDVVPDGEGLMWAVAAVKDDGAQRVWQGAPGSGTFEAVQPGSRAWINLLAPGCDIVGLRGSTSVDDTTTVVWSGSSFASAIGAGLRVRGQQFDSQGPPAFYDYAKSGLVTEDNGSCAIP